MKYDFIISGIKLAEVKYLYTLDEQELKAAGVAKIRVRENPGYPCRISLQDANIDEEVFAFNYEHHQVNSPYRSSGPVFIRLNANEVQLRRNEIPQMLTHRYLSLRVYDEKGSMIDATTVDGKHLKRSIQAIFENKKASYIQVHNAKPGCYNCQVDRVVS